MYHLRRKIHFVIMHSVFDSPVKIDTIYDLKGSRIGRSATQKERESGGVLKDNDIVENNVKIHLGSKREPFLKQLERDANFLASLNIMDYSLLLGVHNRSNRVVMQSPDGEDGAASAVGVASHHHHHHAGDTPLRSVSLPKPRSNTPFRSSVTALQINTASLNSTAELSSSPPRAGRPTSSRVNSLQQRGSKDKRNSKDSTDSTNSPTVKELFRDDGDGAVSATSSGKETEPTKKAAVVFSDPTGPDVASEVSAAASESEEDGDEYSDDDEYDEDVDDDDVDFGDSDIEEEMKLELEEEAVRELGGAAASKSTLSSPSGRRPLTMRDHADTTANEIILGEPVGVDTVGALGSEGYRLCKVFKSPEALSSLQTHTSTDQKQQALLEKEGSLFASLSSKFSMQASNNKLKAKQKQEMAVAETLGEKNESKTTEIEERTYGPGITFVHPWTSRADGGINSREPNGRGDQIYFAGIIDILQEYNTHKYAETLIKVRFYIYNHT